jgi:hypothetical protein
MHESQLHEGPQCLLEAKACVAVAEWGQQQQGEEGEEDEEEEEEEELMEEPLTEGVLLLGVVTMAAVVQQAPPLVEHLQAPMCRPMLSWNVNAYGLGEMSVVLQEAQQLRHHHLLLLPPRLRSVQQAMLALVDA